MPLLSIVAGLTFAGALPQADLINESDIRRDLTYLASEKLEGRFTGSRGERKSADYIADQVRRAGLKPLVGNSYFHDFPLTAGRAMGLKNRLKLSTSGGKSFDLRPGHDFVPLFGSVTPKPVEAEVVWVGGGVVNASKNDYGDVDVKGKIVLALRGPESNSAKARTATERGAIGIVFIGPQADGSLDLPRIVSSQGLGRNARLAGAAVTARWAESLTGAKFADLANLKAKPLGVTMTLETDLVPNRLMGRNVIAILPGTDPNLSQQYIIFGAHHDHLGYAETGSRTGAEKMHLGADDNGSGSAAILSIARYFAASKQNRRPIIFQWYSGEELGLLGSADWAKNHPEILKRTTLMINLDMVGRVREGKLSVFGSEITKEMPEMIKSIQVSGLKLDASPSVPPNSDHASFTARMVPAVHAFSGLHPEYHTESDTLETINWEGIVQSARAMAALGLAADRLDFPMIFRKPPAGRPDMGSTRPTNTARRVRTGFMPDMSGTGPGMLIQGTIAGSPAEKAGIKAGDRLIRVGNQEVKSVDDLQQVLTTAQPGVPVKVVVLRDGKEIELTMTPEAASPQG